VKPQLGQRFASPRTALRGRTALCVREKRRAGAACVTMLPIRDGYEPVGFESPTTALKAFTDDPRRFDLVLTDEMMPELTGTGLALEVHRIRSDIPILIMSGYVNSVDNGVALRRCERGFARTAQQSRHRRSACAHVACFAECHFRGALMLLS
jgi:CheY-like chemotaxis protein